MTRKTTELKIKYKTFTSWQFSSDWNFSILWHESVVFDNYVLPLHLNRKKEIKNGGNGQLKHSLRLERNGNFENGVTREHGECGQRSITKCKSNWAKRCVIKEFCFLPSSVSGESDVAVKAQLALHKPL